MGLLLSCWSSCLALSPARSFTEHRPHACGGVLSCLNYSGFGDIFGSGDLNYLPDFIFTFENFSSSCNATFADYVYIFDK